MATRKIEVEIVGDDTKLSRAFGQAGKESEKLGTGLSSHVGGGLKKVGEASLIAGGALVGGVVAGLTASADEAVKNQKAMAQVEAVIKSTGGAAHISAKGVEDMGTNLALMSGQSKENIVSAEQLALHFTNLRNSAGKGNDIFNRVTKSAVDMAAATGKSAPQAMKLLAKGVNDPLKGLTGLSRMGVTFTKGQQDMVKKLVASGQNLKAQHVILGAVEKRYHGAADAAGKTFAGGLARMHVMLGVVEERIGNKLLPVLMKLMDFAMKHWPEFEKYATIAFNAIGTLWDRVLSPVFVKVGDALKLAAEYAQKYWPVVKKAAQEVMEWYQSTLQPAIATVISALMYLWRHFGGYVTKLVKDVFNLLKAIIVTDMHIIRDVISIVLDVISGHWGKAWGALKQLVRDVFNGIKAILGAYVSIIGDEFAAIGHAAYLAFQGALGKLAGLGSWLLHTAAHIGGRFVQGFMNALGSLGSGVLGIVKGAINYGIIDPLNNLINKAVGLEKDIPGSPNLGIKHNPVGHLYAGAVVTRPTTLEAGEAGPEAIVPLTRPVEARRVLADAAQRLGVGNAARGAGGLTVIQNIYPSGAAGDDPQALMSAAAWRLRTVTV